MKIKPGDIVRYLNSTGGGKVISIIDKDHVEIEDEMGFLLSVRKKDLVVIGTDSEHKEEPDNESKPADKDVNYVKSNSYNYAERDQWDYLENNHNKEKSENTQEKPNEVCLAFIKDSDPDSTDVHLFLVNNYITDLLFSVNLKYEDQYTTLENGFLKHGYKTNIATFKLEEMVNTTYLNVQLIFTKKALFNLKQPVDYNVKVKPAKLYKDNLFVSHPDFQEPVYLISIYKDVNKIEQKEELTKHQVKEIIESKKNIIPDTTTKINISKLDKNEIFEVDLHINKIIDDYKGLSNSEILAIQLGHFRKTLESAIANKIRRIVFIHGIGNGTLKYEIRRILDEEYSELEYQDASFQEYGYGATMVINTNL
ncbi:MAG: DUF2027 domain-containing protein [Marinilabiliales bacterium]